MDQTTTDRHICVNCGYMYDPVRGDAMNAIDPGIPWAQLPETWVCPMCYATRDAFDLFD